MRSTPSTVRRIAAPLSVAALAAALLVTPSAASAGTAAPVTLKVATSSTIDTFNPFISIYLTPTGINRMVYENLVQYSSTARSWAWQPATSPGGTGPC